MTTLYMFIYEKMEYLPLLIAFAVCFYALIENAIDSYHAERGKYDEGRQFEDQSR